MPPRTLLLLLLLVVLSTAGSGCTSACVGWLSGDDERANDVIAPGSASSAAVLLDGRRTSCVNDELVRGSGQIPVGNVRTAGNCSSEVAAFSEGHAMQLMAPITVWTDDGGDVLNVNMTKLLNVPLAVWILYQNPKNTKQDQVEDDVNRAAHLYDTEQCGVEFDATVTDSTGSSFPVELIEADCSSKAAFKAVAFQAGKINVYYIDTVNWNQGQRCPDGNSDVILIGGSTSDNETLAHELGHTFSLGHWNLPQAPGDNNLMLSPGAFRNNVSIGQCFRSSVNGDSVLNRSAIRTGPTRSCPDTTTNATCPSLGLQ